MYGGSRSRSKVEVEREEVGLEPVVSSPAGEVQSRCRKSCDQAGAEREGGCGCSLKLWS